MAQNAAATSGGAAHQKFATAEDQCQINKFARLHKNYVETKAELKLITNELQNLCDAEDEVLLLDDEDTQSIAFQLGSVFVHYDQETLNAQLERSKQNAKKKAGELETQVTKMEEEMKVLRAILYAKFGDNIHLETEVDE